MSTGMENPSERPKKAKEADDAMASVVREFNGQGFDPNSPQATRDLEAASHTLQATGVLPGLTIEGLAPKPGAAPNTLESVKLATTDPKTGGTIKPDSAVYDSEHHVLTYDRSNVLLGTPEGNTEHVTVDMLTGRETVETDGLNGTHRTTTREYVGAPDPTTVVTGADGRVVQTEAIKNGERTITQFHNDGPNGQVTGYSTQIGDGKPEEHTLPPGVTGTVDKDTGVLVYESGDKKTKTMVTPQGRTFNVDEATGKTSYKVKPGDTLWDVARDLARVQYDPKNPNSSLTPSDTEIQNIVNKIGHAGVNGDPNAIRADETINFGTGTAVGDDLDLRGSKPSEAPLPPAPPADAPHDGPLPQGVQLPGDLQSAKIPVTGYKQVGNKYTATLQNGATVEFDSTDPKNYKYTPKGGKTYDFHQNNGKYDNGWTVMEDGTGHQILSIDSIKMDDDGVLRFHQKGWLGTHLNESITDQGIADK